MNLLYGNLLRAFSSGRLRFALLTIFLLLASVMTTDVLGGMNADRPSSAYGKVDIARLIALADSYKKRDMTDSALACFARVTDNVTLSSPLADREKSVSAFLSRGNLLFTLGRFTDAFETYIKGLKIAESCPDCTKTMNFYNNIGNIYCYFGDYEKGLAYYETAYRQRTPQSDRKVVSNLLINMTGAYCFMGRLDKARKSYALAAEAVKTTDNDNRYMMLYNKGLILDLEGKAGEAADYFRKASAETASPYYRCHAYEKLYLLYKKAGRRDSTFHYLKTIGNLSRQYGFNEFQATSLKGFADWYDAAGDKNLARTYRDSLQALTDSVIEHDENMREFYRIRNIQNLYEIGKTEKRIGDLEAERQMREQQVRSQRIILIIVSVSLLAICALLVVVNRQKRKLYRSYNELFEFNRTLTASLPDKAEKSDKPDKGDEAAHDTQTCGFDKKALAEKITAFMDSSSDFMSPDFTLPRLAELVDSNQKYVSQVINDVFGRSFTDFVNERRVRQAQALLMAPEKCANLTLEAVGEKVGFGSHSTFIRAFRKFTGLTPSIYRKIALQKANSSGNS